MIDVLLPAFMIGLLGSPHCLGMCGGLAVLAGQRDGQPRPVTHTLLLHGARLTSYTLLGLLAGTLGRPLSFVPELAVVARLFAGGMLFAMGLYLGGWWQGLRHIERLGARLWQHLSGGRAARPDSVLGLGLMWGLLPCGLVYSTLLWALATGDPQRSPMIMLAFGIGTLPSMLATSWLSISVRRFISQQNVRRTGAVFLMAAGIWTGLYPLVI